jgi:hypothetical protein
MDAFAGVRRLRAHPSFFGTGRAAAAATRAHRPA